MNKTNLELDHIAKLLEDIVYGLVHLYILTIPFQSIGLRLTGITVGLPELVFLLLFPLTIIQIMISRKKIWLDRLDILVFGWILVNIFSGLHAGFNLNAITEVVNIIYLVALYLMLKWTINDEHLSRITYSIITSATIAAIIGIIGFTGSLFGLNSNLTLNRYYPYFGYVYQAMAFTPSPNMLASILMIAIIIKFSQYLEYNKLQLKDGLTFLTLTIGFILTFSKTIICLLIGIILVHYFSKSQHYYNKYNKISVFLSTIILTSIFIFGSHIIVIRNNSTNIESLSPEYIIGEKLGDYNNIHFYPTYNIYLKKTAIKHFQDSRLIGNGPGSFLEFVINRHFDPHSSYFGVLSELGIIGFLILLCIVMIIAYNCHSLIKNSEDFKWLSIALTACFVAIFIEAIVTDIMNFRHYWILIALNSILKHRYDIKFSYTRKENNFESL